MGPREELEMLEGLNLQPTKIAAKLLQYQRLLVADENGGIMQVTTGELRMESNVGLLDVFCLNTT